MKSSSTSNKFRSKENALEILKKSSGAWIKDDWPETEKKRRKIELQATKERKTFYVI